jgi:hypothetical protein
MNGAWTSWLYCRWWGEKLSTMMPATTIVGEFLATFKEYPNHSWSASGEAASEVLLYEPPGQRVVPQRRYEQPTQLPNLMSPEATASS